MSEYTEVAQIGDIVIFTDPDAFPIAVVVSDEIDVHVWQQVYDEHMPMLIVNGLEPTDAISAEEFLAERESLMSRRAYRITRWKTVPSMPSVRDYHGVTTQGVADADALAEDPLANTNFVHLHTHTEHSPLDGLSRVDEVLEVIQSHGQAAVGSCDHGNCAVHPEMQKKGDAAGVKVIHGMEGYFVPDRFRRTRSWHELDGIEVNLADLSKEDAKKAVAKNDLADVKGEYTHISLWAQTQNGLRNLWAISTEGYRDGLFDGKPRFDWDTLERLQDGVICGTGCLRGPVTRLLITCGGCGHERSKHGTGCEHVTKREGKDDVPCPCTGYDDQTDLARDALMRLSTLR